MTTTATTTATTTPFFAADYCLRCGTLFRDGQRCPAVKGGPDAKYRQIVLCICEDCLAPPTLDVPVALILYSHPAGIAGAGRAIWGTPGARLCQGLDARQRPGACGAPPGTRRDLAPRRGAAAWRGPGVLFGGVPAL